MRFSFRKPSQNPGPSFFYSVVPSTDSIPDWERKRGYSSAHFWGRHITVSHCLRIQKHHHCPLNFPKVL